MICTAAEALWGIRQALVVKNKYIRDFFQFSFRGKFLLTKYLHKTKPNLSTFR